MKKLALVVLSSGFLVAGSTQVHLYDVKSGKITYEIKGSGNIMGSKMQIMGKKRVIFDKNGAQNLTEEVKVQKQNIMGHKQVTKTHTIIYLKDGMVYHVDFNRKRIMRMENIGMGMANLMAGGKNMKQAGKDMMKKMGGKKIGTDKVLGYSCDVWSLMGVKQCIYKGVTLRVISNVMGLKTVEVATKAEFDISLSKDDFKLPDFPIYDMQGNKLEKSKLDAMDKSDSIKNKKANQEMAEMGAVMANAAKKAGIKRGAHPTKTQEKALENAMMSAMLPQIKAKILSQGKALVFAKECLSSADVLKDAKKCEQKMESMIGHAMNPEDKIKKWDSQTKKDMLKLIDQGLESMNCAQKAKNMEEMQRCMAMSK